MQNLFNIKKTLQYSTIAFFAVVLFSCENNLKVVQELTREDTLSAVSAYEIVYTRSDSGHVQVELIAPVMNRFENENPYIEFPEGFEAYFYDSAMQKTSFIRADYGMSEEKTNLMTARKNVEVENFKTHEKLNTETLFWDQKKKLIYTSAFVKITTPDKIVYGDSLTATEGFDKRTIHNIQATLELEESELE